MIEVKTKLRRWGNSFGVVVPQKVVDDSGFKEGEEIEILIETKSTDLRKLFGKHKFKKSTEDLMREIDEDLYDD